MAGGSSWSESTITLEGVQVNRSSGTGDGDVASEGVAGGAVAQGVVASSGHGEAAAFEVLHDAGSVAAGEMDAIEGGVPVDAVGAEGDDVAAIVFVIDEEGDEFVAAGGIGFEGV